MSLIYEQEMSIFTEGTAETESTNEGPNIDYSFSPFIFEIFQNNLYEELTDEEVLTLAEKTGTFDFLNEPEEDIYKPSDGTPI